MFFFKYTIYLLFEKNMLLKNEKYKIILLIYKKYIKNYNQTCKLDKNSLGYKN